MAIQEAEHNLKSVIRGHMCTNIFVLLALGSGLFFVLMWEMPMNHIILCCFGDKSCEMVSHVQKINCSAMLGIFV